MPTVRSSAIPVAIPLVPLVLGLAGLIPFWGLALGLMSRGGLGLGELGFGVAPIDLALATYAAIILSFLGGMRWGLAVGAEGGNRHYVIAVLPSLVAWACLLAPEPWRLSLLGIVALGLGPIDLDLVRAGLAPPWFGRLRLILSTGAGVALLLGAFAMRLP